MTLLNWISLANHLWQSTVFAIAAGLLAFALRQNRAHIRHTLWLAASFKFLIPFGAISFLSKILDWHLADTTSPLPAAIAQASEPFLLQSQAASIPAPSSTGWPGILLVSVWFTGCAVLAIRRWLQWRTIALALSQSHRLAIGGPVEVRSSPARLEPGIFGVFRPVLLLPEGIADRLDPAQFRAILTHEFCHVRRRDHLSAALHLVTETIFWFHPFVWWIGGHLVEERERACDEAVLHLGSRPEVYAAAILNVCRFYLETPLTYAPGVTGADLKRRIEQILMRRTHLDLSNTRKLLLMTAAATAVAWPLIIAVIHANAQTQEERLRFEVASIKPMKSEGGRGGFQTLPGGGLRLSGVTLKNLIALGYNVRESQIAGGAKWMETDAYGVDARPEKSEAGAGISSAPGTVAWSRLEQRVQSLLADRFHLVIHKEVKQGSILVLSQAKGGSKLEPLSGADDVPPGTMRSANSITGRAGTMQMLATLLSNWMGRPVEDRTGLTGRYNYKVEYAPQTAPGPDGAGPEASGPSIYTALQEQLGLKLESGRGEIVTIVIDHATPPTAN